MSSKLLDAAFTRFAIAGLALAGIAGRLPAQTGKGSSLSFEQISLPQGLSQSIVKAIAQDRLGFMYFGTEDGLNRYDGYRFSIIRHDPGDANSLSYNDINALCVDRRGFVWAGTYNAGLNRYDPLRNRCLRFRHAADDPASLSHDNVQAILEDAAGAIWVGTQWGLNQLTPDAGAAAGYRLRRFVHEANDPSSLGGNSVLALCLDRDGALCIGSDSGLDRLEPDGAGSFRFRHSLSGESVRSLLRDRRGELWAGTSRGLVRLVPAPAGPPSVIRYRHDPRDEGSLSHDEVFALQEDESGTLWVGTNGGGICLFDRRQQAFSRYRHEPLHPRSISYNEVRAIFRDRQGIMWIGTYGAGINKVTRSSGQFVHFAHVPNSPDSIGHPIVWSICEDARGLLWIGSHGGGLDCLDRKNGRFRHYRADPARADRLSAGIVRVVRDDGAGGLWVGTHGGGLCRFDSRTERFRCLRNDPRDPASLGNDQVREIFRDRGGTVWVGTYGSGLDQLVDEAAGTFRHFRNVPGDPRSLSNDYIRVIHEDANGNLWIGTEGGGLNLFDRRSGTFRVVRPRAGVSVDYVFAIHQDPDGILWLGTMGNGLVRCDPRSGEFRGYTARDGLPSSSVYGILEDEKGRLWLSTNNGLAQFDPRRSTFRNFGTADGLQEREFNGGAYFKSRDGEMFFGGINGFNAFYPSRIRTNDYIPPVVIESFQKFNKDVDLGWPVQEAKEIRLSHKDTVFSFEFAALDFTAPVKNQYKYRMQGLSEEWIETSAEKRFAHFTTVAPGRYLFQVMGSNSDGAWNENAASLRITITPPFWQTWWFRLPLLLGLVLLFAAWNRSRMRRMAARIRTEAAMEQFLDRQDVSAREKDIIRLLLKGKSNKEIEEELFISMGTVKNHVYNIYQKLGVKNRAQLITLFKNLPIK